MSRYERDIYDVERALMVEITDESGSMLTQKVNGIRFLAYHRQKVGNESTCDREVFKTIKFKDPLSIKLAIDEMFKWFHKPMKNPNKYACSGEAKSFEPKMRYHYWNAMGYSGMTIENGILQFEFN
jgi:hypothetical protein